MKHARIASTLFWVPGQQKKLLSLPSINLKNRKILLVVLWLVCAILPFVGGVGYYLTPLTDRPYTEAHTLFKPSGIIGQGLGIFGTLLMLFGVISYMIRKRWSFLARFGKLRSWLTFHIFLCTLGPFYVLLHTTFKFGNIASISFWSMAVVVASGVFGRYVYIHIPKAQNGKFYTPQMLKHTHTRLVKQLCAMTRLPAKEVIQLTDSIGPTKSITVALFKTIWFNLTTKRLAARYQQILASRNVPREVIRKVVPVMMNNARLQLRLRVMGPFIRGFGYWHVLHIPLALVMLAALVIHVGIAIAFGYTWIF